MKEIVSIQVGSYANFVGSHFWNLHDELLGLQNQHDTESCFLKSGVNFDVLYRVGETAQGLATYTPRLLSIDARGNLGAVKATGSLYEQSSSVESSSVTSWKGQVSKHISEPHVKNEFLQSLEQEELAWNGQQEEQQPTDSSGKFVNHETTLPKSFEDSVHYWTDYSKVHFHPQSLYELEGVWHEATPFDDYGSGKGLLRGVAKEDVLDRLRFFVEEADHLQGLQVLVDDSNGFAAVASEVLEEVANDYGSQIMLYTVRPPSSLRRPSTKHDSIVREYHDAISFSELSSFVSYTIPLGLSSFSGMSRYLQVHDPRNFQTSAVYAAALSCATLPLRMDLSGQTSGTSSQQVGAGGTDMGSLVQVLLGQMGRRVSMLSLAMPSPPIPGPSPNKLEAFDYSRLQPLLSGIVKTDDQLASESIVVQGAQSAGLAARASVQDMLSCFSGKQHSRFYHVAASCCPLALPLPFPDLFAPSKELMAINFSSIPIATTLSASTALLPYLERRLQTLRHPGGGSAGWQTLEGWGVQKDDIRELCEQTSNVAAAYGSTEVESSSDSE